MSVRRSFHRRRLSRATLGAAASVTLAVAGWAYISCAPLAPLADREAPGGTVVLDSHGIVLQRDTAAGLRIPISLDRVAPAVIEATIAAEDQRFRGHSGIDPLAIARAALRSRSTASGASTITQQLARRIYLHDNSPSLIRKAREAVLALRIEAHASKDEILAAYLNDVYYGRGAYGIEAAARTYFGVAAKDLNLAQAAFLAGLPQNPESYDPGTDREAATARQAYVLRRMRGDGLISSEQERTALAEPLSFVGALAPVVAPHFVNYALDELRALRPDLADRQGLVIETTLDAGLQAEAERSVRQRLAELRDRNVTNAAAVVLDPRDGRILAMVGSADFDDAVNGGQNNLALASRQPGSALKPFLYTAALEQGYTAASQLLDVATTFDTAEGPYSPGNYDRRFHGPVPLRTALASSYNVPAVRTLADLGIDRFLETAHRFGLDTLTEAERYGLALTLGGGEVRLLDLTAAYGVLANGGERREPYAVARVRDASGQVLYERGPGPARQIIAAEHAWLITDILRDGEARIPGFGQLSPLESSAGAAVKTGTTTGFRDNWTVGYTPGRVAGVWVGNANGQPMDNVSGVAGAAPIWRDVIEAAVEGEGEGAGWPAPPATLVRAPVCSPTGLRPGPACPSPGYEWFVRGTEPLLAERYYVARGDGTVAIDPPAEARAWAFDAGLPLASGAPADAEPVRIVSPARGSVLFRSPELPAEELLLRASAANAASFEFAVDGRPAGRTNSAGGAVRWRLDPGHHELEVTAVLRDGSRLTTRSTYEVRER